MERKITRTVTEYMNARGTYFTTLEAAIHSDLDEALKKIESPIGARNLLIAVKGNPTILTLLKEYFEE